VIGYYMIKCDGYSGPWDRNTPPQHPTKSNLGVKSMKDEITIQLC